jgi:hypothetical protein
MIRSFKIGIFSEEDKFLSSLEALQENKVKIHDVFTPYPVHEVFHLLKRKSRLPTAAYFFGLTAIILVLGFLYYTSVISWPLVYGGKPFNSFPSFIVVTIVLTIFTVTIASLAAFSARSKLYPGRGNTIFDPRATDDKFVIVVDIGEEGDSAAATAETLMREKGATEILNKEFENITS